MRSRWSPWISTAPSLTAPPAPQRRLSSVARASRSRAGRPRITVTTLPFRPPRSRKIRTTPSSVACGAAQSGGPDCAGAGWRMRPLSVEYTRREFFMAGSLASSGRAILPR